MIAQFSRLVQGEMTVAEYHACFIDLSQYDPSAVAKLTSRCIKFREGLRPNIRSQLAPFSFIKFHELFSTVQRIENDILRNTEERNRDIRTLAKKKREHQCKGKDRKEMLLVAVVDLLGVVVSCPILTTLVVKHVIVNESVPYGDNKLCWLEKGNNEVSLVQCVGEIKVGSPDLPVSNNRLHQILVL